jgi:hypothetical protein
MTHVGTKADIKERKGGRKDDAVTGNNKITQ